jgi:hypothetical protein
MLTATGWDPITDIGQSAAQAVFGALWTEIGNACQSVTTALWHAITSSTDISFTTSAWTGSATQGLLGVVGELSAAVMLLMVMLAVIRAVGRGDPSAAGRAVLVDLPIACIGAVALVGFTAVIVAASDQAADGIMSLAPGAALTSFAANWPAVISNLQFVGGVGGLLFIVGAFMVWLELLVRAGLVYLMVATGPLLLAMRIFPGFAPAWKKFAETALAVICSKIFIAIALVLGLSLTTGGLTPTGGAATTGENIGQLLAGIGMMALAAFAPFVVLRFLPVVEAALIAQGISHMPFRAAQQGMQTAYYAQGLSRLAGTAGAVGGAAGAGGGGGGGSGGGGAGAGGGSGGAGSGSGSGGAGGGGAGGGGGGAAGAGSGSGSGGSDSAADTGGASGGRSGADGGAGASAGETGPGVGANAANGRGTIEKPRQASGDSGDARPPRPTGGQSGRRGPPTPRSSAPDPARRSVRESPTGSPVSEPGRSPRRRDAAGDPT